MTEFELGLLRRLVSGDPYGYDSEWGHTSCDHCGCAHPPRYNGPQHFGHWVDCDWMTARRLVGLPLDDHYVWDTVAHCEDCSAGATIIDHMAHKAAELAMWRIEWDEERAEHPERFDFMGTRRINWADLLPAFVTPRGAISFANITPLDIEETRND